MKPKTPDFVTLCLIVSVFGSEARRSAVSWGTSEFPGQLIALLLVAQWLEYWCASLAAQIRILAVYFRVSYYKGELYIVGDELFLSNTPIVFTNIIT